jgi:hypothetical protein
MLRIAVSRPTKIYLKVSDPSVKDTDYTNRFITIDDEQTLYVRMPISPMTALITIKSEAELSGGTDKSYELLEVKKLPLKRKLTAFNHANATVRNFVKFAEEFSQKAGYISAGGSIYTSDDEKFRIDYFNDILGDNGKSLKTPARISRSQGVIEVSKEKFKNYTVPMRMAILLHEFSHYYLNTNMANETEADLNGLLIYLGLGYPRIDAYNVFTQVFMTSANEMNHERMKIIDEFIRNFEKKYVEMTYDDQSLYKNYI